MPKGDAPPAKRARPSARVVEDSDGWSSESDASDDRPIAIVAQEKESARAREDKVRRSRVDRVVGRCDGRGSAAGLTASPGADQENPNAWHGRAPGATVIVHHVTRTSHRNSDALMCMQPASTAEIADPGKETAIPCGSPPKRNAVPPRAPPAASEPPSAATSSLAPSSSDGAGSSGMPPERSPLGEAARRLLSVGWHVAASRAVAVTAGGCTSHSGFPALAAALEKNPSCAGRMYAMHPSRNPEIYLSARHWKPPFVLAHGPCAVSDPCSCSLRPHREATSVDSRP
jgi:hypothetical protein